MMKLLIIYQYPPLGLGLGLGLGVSAGPTR